MSCSDALPCSCNPVQCSKACVGVQVVEAGASAAVEVCAAVVTCGRAGVPRLAGRALNEIGRTLRLC